MTLVNKITWVLHVQFYNASPVYYIVCSPSKVKVNYFNTFKNSVKEYKVVIYLIFLLLMSSIVKLATSEISSTSGPEALKRVPYMGRDLN